MPLLGISSSFLLPGTRHSMITLPGREERRGVAGCMINKSEQRDLVVETRLTTTVVSMSKD